MFPVCQDMCLLPSYAFSHRILKIPIQVTYYLPLEKNENIDAQIGFINLIAGILFHIRLIPNSSFFHQNLNIIKQ